jgi:hypothetical protein
MKVNVRSLDPVPRGRLCTGCGGGLRFSHVAYAGRGEGIAVQVCKQCGLAYRGGARGGEPSSGGKPSASGRQSKRSMPDEGAPANPVLDDDTARLLRERFSGS